MPKLHLLHPDGSETALHAQTGANLLTVLHEHLGGHPSAPCGGNSTCLKCGVRITDGAAGFAPTLADRKAFSQDQLDDGWRLACRIILRAESELWLEHPGAREGEVCETSLVGRAPRLAHALRRVTLSLPPPEINDQRPDAQRLLDALQQGESAATGCPLPVLRQLPGLLRGHGFRLDAVRYGRDLLDVRPPASGRLLGAAVDLGTTTVALALYDLTDGRLLHIASAGNRQAEFGDDVISRITASGKPDGITRLQRAAQETIRTLLREACAASGVCPSGLASLTVAGNTVMQHLLAGVSPLGIGTSPFTPAFTAGQTLTLADILPNPDSAEASRRWPETAPAYLLPCIGPYVGGDITAGILSQQLTERDGNHLLIDAGTNGEIVLRAGGKLYACSTAAGPAFEGARISCGMRACDGAIHEITLSHPLPAAKADAWPLDTEFCVQTLHGSEASGVCGSGLLDAVARLLDTGLIDETGALADADELPEGFPPKLRARLREDGVLLADDVLLTRKDIREFQLACAAIQAGARVLLKEAGINAEELDSVLLAGGFGSHLSVISALRTGLIPPGVSAEKVRAAGNASLAGARLCLLEEAARQEAETVRRETRCIELSGRADFQEFYLDAMEFPSP